MFSISSTTRYFVFLAPLLLQACSSSPASFSSSASSSSPSPQFSQRPQSTRYQVKQDYGPENTVDVSHIKNAVPKKEAKSRYGNPKEYKVLGKWYKVSDSSEGYAESGIASWYGKKFHGHRTSSGETYDMYAMTAAHKTLPLPTYVQVTNLDNDRSVIVKVNDRGPFHEGRIIDLSYTAAKKLGVTATGTGRVKVVAIDAGNFQEKQIFEPKIKRTVAIVTKKQVLSKSKLYLQAGAFSEKKNAIQLQRRLIRMFSAKKIHSEFEADKNIYRVRIGPLVDQIAANKISTQLLSKGITTKTITLD